MKIVDLVIRHLPNEVRRQGTCGAQQAERDAGAVLGEVAYHATVINFNGRYAYRVGNITVDITEAEYQDVIGNPVLHYFSTALKLDIRVDKSRKRLDEQRRLAVPGPGMLGWEVFVQHELNFQDLASANSSNGTTVTSWRASIGGLAWLDALVKSGQAVDLGGNGYPCRYKIAIDVFLKNLPRSLLTSADATFGDAWRVDLKRCEENLSIRNKEVAIPRPTGWLIVEAWDQS